MTECFLLGCKNEAVHKITDAEQNPEQFNGKIICEECQENRALLKKEPEVEEDE